MTTPAVSVIVPTYNYARFLPGALDSALRQTFWDFEILVIDDGSTDDTPEVMRPYLADSRVRYQRIANGGPARARNVGIGLARAPLVAFLDADDLWLPAKLERQVALFRRDPGVGLVYTRRRLMDEEGHDLDCGEPASHRDDVLRALLAVNFLCLTTCMIRRSVFETVGTFDEALKQSEDFDLWLRIAARYRFDYVDEQLVRYRVGHASISRHVEERMRTVVHILRRFAERRGRDRVSRALIRWKVAGVYNDGALQLRGRLRLRALSCYCRALWTCPGYGPAWLGLGSLLLPELIRRLLRRALGKPVDWRVRHRSQPPLAARVGFRREPEALAREALPR